MDKLDIAIRQVVTYFLEQCGEKEIFAMCFRIHFETNADIEWRYLCEPIVQAREAMNQMIRKAATINFA